MTREEWLLKAVNLLAPYFKRTTSLDVPDVRVSVGWPGGGSRRTRIGECWSGSCATDGLAQIFISPVLHEPVKVLGTLAHELVHATVGTKHGHKGEFRKVAKAIGLTGKMTATTVGDDLLPVLEGIAETLGEYPHAALSLTDAGRKKQTTRMLKVWCPNSEYTVRMTRKWLDEWGAPTCPCCNMTMEEC